MNAVRSAGEITGSGWIAGLMTVSAVDATPAEIPRNASLNPPATSVMACHDPAGLVFTSLCGGANTGNAGKADCA